MERIKKTKWSKEQALIQLRKWCADQDRCQKEVRTKLIEHQIYGDELEQIIADLISDGFINEQRFAKSYVRGKFRMNNWGKIKIRQGLLFFNISPYCIKKGFLEIDENEYLESLNKIIEKKWTTLNRVKSNDVKKKIFSYAAQKGFEGDLISHILSEKFQ